MYKFISSLLIGLSLGAIYSLMSISLVLVWRSTRVVNFAQAGQAIVSTYIAYEVVNRTGSFWLAFIVAILAGALLGAIVDRYFMRPLFRRVASGPIVAIAPVVATLGLLGVLRAVVGFIWGVELKPIAAPVSLDGYNLGSEVLPFAPYNALVIVIVAIVLIVLSLLFQKTNLGLSLRASAYSPEIARLSGVRVNEIRTLGWAIAGAAGAIAGILATPTSYLSPNSLDILLVFGFAAAVIGGLESMVGAVAGGLVLGLGVTFVSNYVSTSLTFPTAFVFLIIILLVRPSGIVSGKRSRRA
jgi:branched-chain amino acid transport system permease protein